MGANAKGRETKPVQHDRRRFLRKLGLACSAVAYGDSVLSLVERLSRMAPVAKPAPQIKVTSIPSAEAFGTLQVTASKAGNVAATMKL